MFPQSYYLKSFFTPRYFTDLGSGGGTLSLTISTSWSIAQPLTLTRTTDWTVAANVPLTRTTSWSIAQNLPLTISTLWVIADNTSTVNFTNENNVCPPYPSPSF